MLIAMRKGAAGWVAKILFGLLILSFAVWGIGDYLTPDSNPVVAKVGDVEIRRGQVDLAERQQTEQMRRLLGNQFNPSDLPEGALRDAAIEQLVGQAALDMEVRALDIGISDQGIGDAIRNDPSFQQNGKFDADRFRRSLSSVGLNEEAYTQNMRTELRRKQLRDSIGAKISPPYALIETMFSLERQKRSISYVELDISSIEAPRPSDDDLKDYINENPSSFAEPARRDARAIVISTSSVSKIVKISEAEIANYYEDSKERYRTPEIRSLSQALFQNEEDARNFAAKAPDNKQNFLKNAEIAGGSVIDLGELSREQIFPAELSKTAFAVPEGPVSSPISTNLGWHVLFIEKITPENIKPLESVADELKLEMQQEQALSKITDIANAAEDALAAGGDLQAASAASGLPIIKLQGIDRRGVDRDGSVSLEMPADPSYLAAIFERTVGDQSGLIELRDGVFMALIVDKIYESAPKPFDVVRAEASEKWTQKKQLELGQAQLKKLADATSISGFQQASKEAAINITEIQLSSREDFTALGKFQTGFIEQIFSSRENNSVLTNTKNTVIAAFVSDIERPGFNVAGDAEKEFIAGMSNLYANERAELLGKLARTVHPPEITQEPTDALSGSN